MKRTGYDTINSRFYSCFEIHAIFVHALQTKIVITVELQMDFFPYSFLNYLENLYFYNQKKKSIMPPPSWNSKGSPAKYVTQACHSSPDRRYHRPHSCLHLSQCVASHFPSLLPGTPSDPQILSHSSHCYLPLGQTDTPNCRASALLG